MNPADLLGDLLDWWERRRRSTVAGRAAVAAFLHDGDLVPLREVFPRTYLRVALEANRAESERIARGESSSR